MTPSTQPTPEAIDAALHTLDRFKRTLGWDIPVEIKLEYHNDLHSAINCVYDTIAALRAENERLKQQRDEYPLYSVRLIKQLEASLARANELCATAEAELEATCAAQRLLAAGNHELLKALESRLKLAVDALEGIKVRIAFIGWPAETFWEPRPGVRVPDWRKEINLLEEALAQLRQTQQVMSQELLHQPPAAEVKAEECTAEECTFPECGCAANAASPWCQHAAKQIEEVFRSASAQSEKGGVTK